MFDPLSQPARPSEPRRPTLEAGKQPPELFGTDPSKVLRLDYDRTFRGRRGMPIVGWVDFAILALVGVILVGVIAGAFMLVVLV